MTVPPGRTPISMNDFSLKLSLDSIKKKNNQLKTSTSKVPKIKTCRGIMVSEYESTIREISKLLTEYKKLLTKDLEDADTTREFFLQVDRDIKAAFNRIK